MDISDAGVVNLPLTLFSAGSQTVRLVDTQTGLVVTQGVVQVQPLAPAQMLIEDLTAPPQHGQGESQAHRANPADMGEQLPRLQLGLGRITMQLASGAAHTCTVLDTA